MKRKATVAWSFGGAFTLIECVIAVLVLSLSALAVMLAYAAGGRAVTGADASARSIRLCEGLMEEIVGAPAASGGAERAAWGLADYNGFAEEPGTLCDLSGDLYGAEAQRFERTSEVTDGAFEINSLGLTIDGSIVEVRVLSPSGAAFDLSRFVPDEASP